MTDLLQRAIARLEELSPEVQDGAAARILADLEDELAWTQRFEATTPEQWARLAEMARRDIEDGDLMPLDEFLSGGTLEG
jgi:hypothetical protein